MVLIRNSFRAEDKTQFQHLFVKGTVRMDREEDRGEGVLQPLPCDRGRRGQAEEGIRGLVRFTAIPGSWLVSRL